MPFSDTESWIVVSRAQEVEDNNNNNNNQNMSDEGVDVANDNDIHAKEVDLTDYAKLCASPVRVAKAHAERRPGFSYKDALTSSIAHQ